MSLSRQVPMPNTAHATMLSLSGCSLRIVFRFPATPVSRRHQRHTAMSFPEALTIRKADRLTQHTECSNSISKRMSTSSL
ncbi:hypothetical protein LY78DRAFT_651175 [Colletotrichum sublineola]|nr:hypothetical protein LY78DRAFT_651175 [Colletotrichum sublineola]